MSTFCMKNLRIKHPKTRTMQLILILVLTLVLTTARSGICGNSFCITGPAVAESLVFAVMADQNLAGSGIEFIMWNSPDQARAMIATGKTQASLITTSGAATFYNKGVRVGIAGVFSSALWVVSAQICTGTPLTGTLLFPFGPGEMPGLVFRVAMGHSAPELATLHTGGALEAVNRLLMGKAAHALLAEPAASLAVVRSREQNGAAQLVKNLDLREIWARKFNDRPLCVSAFAVFGNALDQPKRIKKIITGYGLAIEWIKAHPRRTLAIAGEKIPAMASLSDCSPGSAGALCTDGAAFDAAVFFLEKIYALDPGAVGGKLPGPDLFMNVNDMRQGS